MQNVHYYKHHLAIRGEAPFTVEATSFIISPLPAGGTYGFCINSIDPSGAAETKQVKAIDGGKYTSVCNWPPCTEFKITGVPSNVTFKIKW